MLVHIPELPQDVRVAYCKLRDQRIWTDWMEKFQSFLPGTTNEQVTWNRALRAWWASYGDCVWNRYFWAIVLGLFIAVVGVERGQPSQESARSGQEEFRGPVAGVREGC
ncbi:hypothetical protein Ae201684_013304 [Aphanomyces euteiches]|uniref:Uncharacterized protein n=1 Tax=Aphanomyces euteiches TaxID=100861 RepID=A0A6G0WNQ1_9STRA|nr:hypothetical protein Ae201684_013304 [Aphanomyces euteiches]